MNLAKSFIAIRHRSLLETMELAISVLRQHFGHLLILGGLGAVPFILLNYWVLSRGAAEYESSEHRAASVVVMLMLVVIQAPAASAFICHYLGQAMFTEKPTLVATLRVVTRNLLALFWLHGVIGMVVPMYLAASVFANSDDAREGLVLPVMVCFVGCLIRVLRPFVSEILLLEQPPWGTQLEAGKVGFGLRSQLLHSGALFEHLGHAVVRGLFAGCLALSLFSSGFWLSENMGLNWYRDEHSPPQLWSLALWPTALFFGVVRFLTYINTRIYQEGWDVELQVRSEAQKLHPSEVT